MEGQASTRFVETTCKGMKMLRAIQHLVHKNHRLRPNRCEGCLEAAGFLTMTDYQGVDHRVLGALGTWGFARNKGPRRERSGPRRARGH
jgi:hypothetical protein